VFCCATAAGYIVNDIFDVKTDLINKPDKTYVTTQISEAYAWVYFAALNFMAIALAFFINEVFLFIVVSTVIALFIYALFVKKIAVFGNVLVAFLSGVLPFLTVWLDVSFAYSNNSNEGYFSLYTVPLYFSFIAFLGSFSREVIKDIEDIEGDRKVKALTLPIILNEKQAGYVAIFSLIIACFLLITYPPILGNEIYMIYFSVAVVAPIILTIKRIYKAEEKLDYSRASFYLKIAMFGVVLFFGSIEFSFYDISRKT
jgi:4-hydroxybenzoate polyprenyltransferase